MSHALVVRGLIKKFGNHVAVDDISFEVPRGVVYGILGPNGAGKSTTLRMINDIFAPDAGEIVVLDGFRPGAEAAARIGYLPEERGLYPKMKVGGPRCGSIASAWGSGRTTRSRTCPRACSRRSSSRPR
jgi:ABC-type uncharacterized transport system ATPase subunit